MYTPDCLPCCLTPFLPLPHESLAIFLHSQVTDSLTQEQGHPYRFNYRLAKQRREHTSENSCSHPSAALQTFLFPLLKRGSASLMLRVTDVTPQAQEQLQQLQKQPRAGLCCSRVRYELRPQNTCLPHPPRPPCLLLQQPLNKLSDPGDQP